jgi:hypothetical protein
MKSKEEPRAIILNAYLMHCYCAGVGRPSGPDVVDPFQALEKWRLGQLKRALESRNCFASCGW